MNEEKEKALKREVGFGYGTTIGHTDDGMVFFVSDTKDPEGRPMNTFIDFTPERAEQIAATFIKAAEQARNAKTKKVA